jgi:hypothetical protein
VPGHPQCRDRAGDVGADINDRLERLRRREELASRAQQRPIAPRQSPLDGRPFPAGLGEDFVDVLDAVARAVLRHPGLSVLVTTGNTGRHGRTVVRVSERDGAVETALVAAPPAATAAEPRRSGRHAEQAAPAAPSVTALSANGTAGSGTPYHRTVADRQPYSRRGAVRQLRAVEDSGPDDAGRAGVAPEDAQPPIAQPPIAQPPNAQPPNAQPPNVQQPNVQQPNVQQPNVQQPNVQQPNAQPRDTQQPNTRPVDTRPADTGPLSAERAAEGAGEQTEAGRSGLLALPPDTSQVVARLAQLLRDDPSLAAGWARGR